MTPIITTLKPRVMLYLKASKDALASMDEIREWNSPSDFERNATTLKNLVSNTVDIVEMLEIEIKDVLSDSSKRQLVIDCLDELITLPAWLEWADNLIIRMTLTYILDERYPNPRAA